MTTASVLPDCRSREARGLTFICGVPWQPIYCASCGAAGGMVPQENTTFAFWLCNPCFATHGELTNVMMMPDEVFWGHVAQEQMEKYGRLLTNEELTDVVAADGSPLATLIKQGA